MNEDLGNPATEEIQDPALTQAINDAREKYDPSVDFESFVRTTGEKFIQNKIDQFPMLCEITRVQNHLKWQELNTYGHRGRFTGAGGFSESGESCFKFEIPKELYVFMTNLVYKEFWTRDNQKISDKFMKKILKGEDPLEILMWVKTIYGPNADQALIV